MRRFVCVTVAFLFIAGQATAKDDTAIPVTADFEIRGPVSIVGDLALEAELSGVLLDPGEGSSFVATVQDATVRAVNVPYRLVMTQESSVLGKNWVAIEEEPELLWQTTFAGTIELVGPGGPESTIRLLPAVGSIQHSFFGTSFEAGAPTRFPTDAVGDHEALGSFPLRPVDSGPIAPEGVYAAVDGSTFGASGSLRAVLYGGDYLAEGTKSALVGTGHSLNSTVSDPLGQVGTWRFDRVVLLVDAPLAEATLAAGGGQVDLLVRQVSGVVAGDVALHGVHGTLESSQGKSSGAFALSQIIGNWSVDAQYGSPSTWSVNGEASYVALDAESVLGSKAPGSTPVLVEAAAVSLLFVAAYAVASFLRRGATWTWLNTWKVKFWLLAPLAARIERKNVALSGPRRAILGMLDSRGMMPLHLFLKAASEALGISTEAVRKHVDLLYAKNAIARVENGRRVFVGPKDGFYKTREEQVAAALTTNEVDQAIGAAVCGWPGLTQKELVASVNNQVEKPLARVAIRKRVEVFAAFEDRATSGRSSRAVLNGDVPCRVIRLVWKKRDGKQVRYEPTKALRRVVEESKREAE